MLLDMGHICNAAEAPLCPLPYDGVQQKKNTAQTLPWMGCVCCVGKTSGLSLPNGRA